MPFLVVGTSLSLHILVSLDNEFLLSDRHLLISPIHSHMLSILAPRKIKFSTITTPGTSFFLGLKLVMFFFGGHYFWFLGQMHRCVLLLCTRKFNLNDSC